MARNEPATENRDWTEGGKSVHVRVLGSGRKTPATTLPTHAHAQLIITLTVEQRL